MSRRTLVLIILFAIVSVGLALQYGMGAAYFAVNKLRTGPMNSSLICHDSSWALPRFRAEAPDGKSSIVRQSGDKCRLLFEVKASQPKVKKGFRTELRTNPVPYGVAHRHCFDIALGPAWPSSSPPVTLAQWHGSPDRLLGESGRSPPLRLMIENNQWKVMHGSDPRRVSTTDDETGPSFQETFSGPVDWGNSVNWCFDVTWLERGRGRYTVTMNGDLVVVHDGAFGFRDWLAPFFKFGVYVPKADEAPLITWQAEFSNVHFETIAP